MGKDIFIWVGVGYLFNFIWLIGFRGRLEMGGWEKTYTEIGMALLWIPGLPALMEILVVLIIVCMAMLLTLVCSIMIFIDGLKSEFSYIDKFLGGPDGK